MCEQCSHRDALLLLLYSDDALLPHTNRAVPSAMAGQVHSLAHAQESEKHMSDAFEAMLRESLADTMVAAAMGDGLLCEHEGAQVRIIAHTVALCGVVSNGKIVRLCWRSQVELPSSPASAEASQGAPLSLSQRLAQLDEALFAHRQAEKESEHIVRTYL